MWMRSIIFSIALAVSSCGGHESSVSNNLYEEINKMDEVSRVSACKVLGLDKKIDLFFATTRRHHGDYSLDKCFSSAGTEFIFSLKSKIQGVGIENDVLHFIVIVISMRVDGLISDSEIVRLDLNGLCKAKASDGIELCYKMVNSLSQRSDK